jgi:hypothetical protein
MVTVDRQNSHDIIVDGLTFRGPRDDPNFKGLLNLSGDGSASSANHITISNSTFGGGIAFNFLKNSQIIHNRFTSFAGSAIRGYHPDNTSFSSNTFIDVAQGIDLVFDAHVPNQGRNVLIANNVGSGFSRMGIETIGNDPPQAGASQNLHVECNRFSDWHNVPGETNTIAYSIVTLGPGTQVLNNYAQGPTNNPNPGWNGYGIELGGPDALAQGNYIDGFTTGIVGYVSGDIIQNNNIINSVGAPIHTSGRTDEIVRSNTTDPRPNFHGFEENGC